MKLTFFTAALFVAFSSFAQKAKKETTEAKKPTNELNQLKFRLVGPALTSGRISDIAVDPENHDTWYVTAASGGVWKTTNHGTTFTPIFDNYGSYSIACVELAPTNSSTIWIGTGENNNQRSVAYGDGVYKSIDGGKSFENMGLKNSEHIGNIIIHPMDENTLWVAAYGPVWSAGGERGVYKSTDGGKTWKKTLEISENTGVSEIAIDPSNPQVLYAAAHQRRRREWTYLGGGPESGLYKSVDGGETWKEINNGLPKNEMGRIGIAVSPANSDYVYAIVEAKNDKGGFFRSTNRGETWTKMSGYSTSGNYYQEIMCDPYNKDKVFSMNTWLHHTDNGGKTFVATGEDKKHVDNHAIWIDPNNTEHWVVGCDGGLYETFNHAKDWKYYANLPIIQFYKVATDNATPFYNIYGGTQDNNSMGGPSASINNAGVLNSDWFITNGGDGFESAIDPTDPNIVYAQAQYGWLVRYDKASGERVPIQPMPGKDEAGYRWNWDAPLLVSPHDHKTIYFAANKVFKSTNRGDDWQVISPDLSQQIDRNKLPVMGEVWPMDAVMKNKSTTIYGNIVALDESPKVKGLLYAGTDDGLVQVSEDDGKTWRKINSFPGVPKNTRVNMICASPINDNEVYVVFNNHRSGDFKPYILQSNDRGKTWNSVASNLPERGSAFCIRQDFKNDKLLFAGTEFGADYSIDKGNNWIKIGGLPTIAVYDLDIQQRENDLVAATFGRGFYVLDNYAPLRELIGLDLKQSDAHLFSIKDALLYVPSNPLGLTGTGSQGADLWAASNPAFGAQFNLYLSKEYKTLKDQRLADEKAKKDAKETIYYPSFETLKNEQQDDAPKLIWIIKDNNGKEIRRMTTSPKKGHQQLQWNLRTESASKVTISKRSPGRYEDPDEGLLVTPGTYSIQIYLVQNSDVQELIAPTKFIVKGLNNQTLLAENNAALQSFRNDVTLISREVNGTRELIRDVHSQIKLLSYAAQNYPGVDLTLIGRLDELKKIADSCDYLIWGDNIKRSLEFEVAPGLASRVGLLEYSLFANTTDVSKTQRLNLQISKEEYKILRSLLDPLILQVKAIAQELTNAGVPYIEGLDEKWKED